MPLLETLNEAPKAGATDDPLSAFDPLVAWRFEGASDAPPLSGTGMVGAAGDGPGSVGDSAARFDADHRQVLVAEDRDAYHLAEGTVSLWFQADHLEGKQGLWSKDSMEFDDGGHLDIRLFDDVLRVRLQSTEASHFVETEAGAVAAGQWHMVTVGFGSSGLTLYLDGREVDHTGYDGGLWLGDHGNENPISLGASQVLTDRYTDTPFQYHYDGALDDVALFDRQFDADEVAALWSAYTEDPALPPEPAGDDVLIGGPGNDVLDGGPGEDVFIFDFTEEDPGVDTILFDRGADAVAVQGAAVDSVFVEPTEEGAALYWQTEDNGPVLVGTVLSRDGGPLTAGDLGLPDPDPTTDVLIA
jgi:hypothetical protein